MKVAAIDLGTNSFLCLICEVSGSPPSASVKVIEDVCRIVRLGEKVHQNRFFLPEALQRAKAALTEFQQLIKKHKVDKVIATATSAARDVSNGEELIRLGRDRGIPIFIIGGPKEAALSFDGAISAIQDASKKKILVVDVGGGSTEFIFREPGHKPKARSFDVGCVRLTEMFLKKDPIDWNEYKNLEHYADLVIKAYGKVRPDLVVAVAGTPTTLACVQKEIDFEDEKVEGSVLTRTEIQKLAHRLGDIPLPARKKIKGLEPLRADVIIAGCALLDRALELAAMSELRVSTRGLRYGVALHHGEF